MLYIAYFIFVGSHNTRKLIRNFAFLTCRGWQFVHTPKAMEPHTNSKFEAFGGPMARARRVQWPLHGCPWVPKYPYCHQMIPQTHPRGDKRVSEKGELWKSCRCHQTAYTTAISDLFRGPCLGLYGLGSHCVGPHGCSSTRIVTKSSPKPVPGATKGFRKK